MALTMHTISGKIFRPDAVTPLVGVWYLEIVTENGYLLDHSFSGFRLGVAEFATESDGTFSFQMPAGHQTDAEPTDFWYRIWFISENGTYKVEKQYFKLLSDMTISDILEYPAEVPVTPSLVTEAKQYRDEAREAAEGVSIQPIYDLITGGEHDLSGLHTVSQDTIVDAINEVYSSVGAGGVSFEYSPSAPAATWSIAVPPQLGRRPQVTLYDQSGNQMFADIQATPTSVSVSFPAPTAGSAVLS